MLKLRILKGASAGTEVPLDRDEIVLGRAQSADVTVDDLGASRRHARICRDAGTWWIEDLRSLNGTYINGRRIERIALEPGAELSICAWACRVEEEAEEPVVVRAEGVDRSAGGVTLVADGGPREVSATIQEELDASSASAIDVPPKDEAGLRQSFERLKILLEVGEKLGTAKNTDELLGLIIDRLFDAFAQADQAHIMLLDPDTGEPVPKLGRHRDADDKQEIVVSRTILRQAISDKKSLLTADAQADARFGQAMSIMDMGIRSAMCAPLLAREKVLGTIHVSTSRLDQRFTRDGLGLLTAIAADAALAIDNANLIGDLHKKNEELEATNEELRKTLRQVDLLSNVKDHLSKFVPESARRMIEENPDDPGLEKRPRDVSIVFMDIEGYTKITEAGASDQTRVDHLVEHYFSRYLDHIYKYGGDINEIAGDGLMIIFQHEDKVRHALNAASASLEIYAETVRINQEVKGESKPVAINIGINSGIAHVGSVRFEGLAGTRWTFTASGPTTILAARLSAFATQGAILVGPETARRIQEDFDLRDVGSQQLKNMREKVRVRALVPD